MAVVTDMGAVHEVTAITHARNAAAVDGAGIHGDLLADGAAIADLELCQLAAIAQRLRRRAQRHEGIDGAVIADRRLRGDVHMRDQIAVGADRDVTADDATGADRGALADHGAIFDPRGGGQLAADRMSELTKGVLKKAAGYEMARPEGGFDRLSRWLAWPQSSVQ